jgi:hypothetical protein
VPTKSRHLIRAFVISALELLRRLRLKVSQAQPAYF